MKEPMQLVWLVFGSIYFVVAERSKKKRQTAHRSRIELKKKVASEIFPNRMKGAKQTMQLQCLGPSYLP